MATQLTVETLVNAPIEKVWKYWITPEHITKWNNASEDWHTPKASNDVKVGGKFCFTMAAKDGSMSFDFGGVYDNVKNQELISYIMEDGRKAKIWFTKEGAQTKIIETFDAEAINPTEMQQAGWQAILNNFKNYTEKN